MLECERIGGAGFAPALRSGYWLDRNLLVKASCGWLRSEGQTNNSHQPIRGSVSQRPFFELGVPLAQ